MEDVENVIAQYTMYETELLNNALTGFILTAETKQDVIYQLEGESFTRKYYLVVGPKGQTEIRSKKELIEWFDAN